MTGSKLQAQHDREDFEHSQASKRRRRVEFISLALSLAVIIALSINQF